MIYSARTIPGNEKAVGRVINLLIEQGIEVITDRTHLVHVSGHPRRAELEELIGWVKPKISHSGARRSVASARTRGARAPLRRAGGPAMPQRRPDAACAEGGLIDEVPVGRLYKDGVLLVEADARTVADRKRSEFCRHGVGCSGDHRQRRAGR